MDKTNLLFIISLFIVFIALYCIDLYNLKTLSIVNFNLNNQNNEEKNNIEMFYHAHNHNNNNIELCTSKKTGNECTTYPECYWNSLKSECVSMREFRRTGGTLSPSNSY